MSTVGVLALQGDFSAHLSTLHSLGAKTREVRRCRDLAGLTGLILPGGESSTMLRLMAEEPWFEALRVFYSERRVLFGTCAGAILLAKEVLGPSQPSVGLLDVSIERNAYGRQVDSFEDEVEAPSLGDKLRGVFIRAPRFKSLGPGVEVLGRHRGVPVLVREGRVLAGTFHPELTSESALHRYFLELARGL